MDASLDVMTSADDCLECGVGTFCPVGSANATLCAPGTVNPLVKQESCVRCAPGTYQDLEGNTTCKDCSDGHYCAEGSAAPLPCPGGTRKDLSLTVMSSVNQCITCDAGHACSVGSAEQVQCLPGSFGAEAGRATCELCAAGKYTPDAGNTACRDCKRGYLCVEGSSAPQPCCVGLVTLV